MQYTANKPADAVLIIQPDGLRYRLKADHLFKNIRYAQITKVKIIKDKLRLFLAIYIPLLVLGQWENIRSFNWDWFTITYFILILLYSVYFFFTKPVYTLAIEKGPLTAEVFMTHNHKIVRQIKKEIESHL